MGIPERLHQNQHGVLLSAAEWLLDHFRAKEEDRQRMVDELDIGPTDHILDSACGPGLWTRLFAEKVAGGGKVTGLDFSPDLLEYARESFEDDALADVVEFVLGDVHDVPFPPESFDLTFLGNCLCYIRDGQDVLEKHKKLTRQGGRLVSKEFDGSAMIFHPVSPLLTLKVVTSAACALEDNDDPSTWFDNFIGRKTHGIFRELGLKDVWTRSYAIQKVAPLTEETKRYIIGNATWYGQTAAPYLSADEQREWAESFDPESESYVLDRDAFYFCMIETMTVGTV